MPDQVIDPKGNIGSLHKTISGVYDVGDLNQFTTALQDDNNRLALWKQLDADKYDVGTFEQFTKAVRIPKTPVITSSPVKMEAAKSAEQLRNPIFEETYQKYPAWTARLDVKNTKRQYLQSLKQANDVLKPISDQLDERLKMEATDMLSRVKTKEDLDYLQDYLNRQKQDMIMPHQKEVLSSVQKAWSTLVMAEANPNLDPSYAKGYSESMRLNLSSITGNIPSIPSQPMAINPLPIIDNAVNSLMAMTADQIPKGFADLVKANIESDFDNYLANRGWGLPTSGTYRKPTSGAGVKPFGYAKEKQIPRTNPDLAKTAYIEKYGVERYEQEKKKFEDDKIELKLRLDDYAREQAGAMAYTKELNVNEFGNVTNPQEFANYVASMFGGVVGIAAPTVAASLVNPYLGAAVSLSVGTAVGTSDTYDRGIAVLEEATGLDRETIYRANLDSILSDEARASGFRQGLMEYIGQISIVGRYLPKNYLSDIITKVSNVAGVRSTVGAAIASATEVAQAMDATYSAAISKYKLFGYKDEDASSLALQDALNGDYTEDAVGGFAGGKTVAMLFGGSPRKKAKAAELANTISTGNPSIDNLQNAQTQNAIQIKAAGQVPVQSGAGSSQKMAQGESQTEAAGDLAAKKADIERRRQEELNDAVKGLTDQISTWEEIEAYTGVKTMEEAFDAIYEIADKAGRVRREQGVSGIRADYTFTEQEQKFIDFINRYLNPLTAKEPIKQSIQELKDRREKAFNSRSGNNRAAKINNKYDAELAALEAAAPATKTEPQAAAQAGQAQTSIAPKELDTLRLTDSGNVSQTGSPIQNYTFSTPEGGQADGTIAGEFAFLRIIDSGKDTEGLALRGTNIFGRLLSKLVENGVTTIQTNMQTDKMKSAIQKMIQIGALTPVLDSEGNPISIEKDGSPTRLTINKDVVAPQVTTQATPQVGSVVGANPAPKDVESTAKALEGKQIDNKIIGFQSVSLNGSLVISEGREVGDVGDIKQLAGNKISLYPDIEPGKGFGQSAYIEVAKKHPTKNIVSGDLSPFAQKMWESLYNKGFATRKQVGVFDNGSQDYQYTLKKYPEIISEAYHKAKADGSNPGLVEAVEQLLSKTNEKESVLENPQDGGQQTQERQEGTQLRTQEEGQVSTEKEVSEPAPTQGVMPDDIPQGDRLTANLRQAIQKIDNHRIASLPKARLSVPVTKVMVNEMASLKDQIRLANRAANNAVATIKQIKEELFGTLKDVLDGLQLSTKQQAAILTKVQRVNLMNPVMVERVITYAERVAADIKYADTVGAVSTKLGKLNPNNYASPLQQELVRRLKKFDPEEVSDLGELDAVVSTILEQPVFDNEFLSDYVTRESAYIMDLQNAARQLSPPRAPRGKSMAAGLGQQFKDGIAQLESIIPNNPDNQKILNDLRLLTDEVAASLKESELIEYINGLDNILLNEDFGGLADISAEIRHKSDMLKLVPMFQGGPLKQVLQVMGNRFLGISGAAINTPTLTQFSQFMKTYMVDSKLAAAWQAAVGFTSFYSNIEKSNRAKENFANAFKKHMGTTALNNVARLSPLFSQFAEVMRYPKGSDRQDSFDIAKKNVEQDIANKVRTNETNDRFTGIEDEIKQWDIIKDFKTPQELEKFMASKYPDVYKAWKFNVEYFKPIFVRLNNNNQAVHGQLTVEEENYIPLRSFKVFGGDVSVDESEFLNPRQENWAPKAKPSVTTITRQKEIGTTTVRDRNIISVIEDRLFKSEFDINTSYDIMVLARNLNALNSEYNNPFFAGQIKYLQNAIKLYRIGNTPTDELSRQIVNAANFLNQQGHLAAMGGTISPFMVQASSATTSGLLTLAADNINPMLFFAPNKGSDAVRNKHSIGSRLSKMSGLSDAKLLNSKFQTAVKKNLDGVFAKIRGFVGAAQRVSMAGTTWGDYLPAAMFWNAAYLGRLEQLGAKFKNWEQEASLSDDPIRLQAAAYAEQRSGELFGESATEKKAAGMVSQEPLPALARGVVIPFGSFRMNFGYRLANAMRVMKNGFGGYRTQGIKDFSIAVAESAAVNFGARMISAQIKASLLYHLMDMMGVLHDPEEDEERAKLEAKMRLTQFISDINPILAMSSTTAVAGNLAPVSQGVLKAANWAYSQYNEDEEPPFAVFEDRGNNFGVYGIFPERMADQVVTGTSYFTDGDIKYPTPYGIKEAIRTTTGERIRNIESLLFAASLFGINERDITNTMKQVRKRHMKLYSE